MHTEDVIDGGRQLSCNNNELSFRYRPIFISFSECMKLNNAFNKNSTFKTFKGQQKKI